MLRDNGAYRALVGRCASLVAGAERLRGKRVLVTGASGLIGSHLADVLRLLGAEVFASGRSLARLERRFGPEGGGLRFVEWDCLSPLPGGLPAFDYIAHAAGGAHPAAFAGDPVGVMESNLLGTLWLLRFLRDKGRGRMAFVSSGEVYGEGDGTGRTFDEAYCGRLDFLEARSCYPASKRAAETLCAAFLAQYGVSGVILRPCHVYGPTGTAGDSRASAEFLRMAARGGDIVMKSDGARVRSYCHVSDCARGMIAAMLDGEDGGAFNIADREGLLSIRAFAELAAEAGGGRLVTRLPEEGEAAGYSKPERMALDAGKLEGLGWRAAVPVREGIAEAVEILREEGETACKGR